MQPRTARCCEIGGGIRRCRVAHLVELNLAGLGLFLYLNLVTLTDAMNRPSGSASSTAEGWLRGEDEVDRYDDVDVSDTFHAHCKECGTEWKVPDPPGGLATLPDAKGLE